MFESSEVYLFSTHSFSSIACFREQMKGDLWPARFKFAINVEGSLPDKFVKTSNKGIFFLIHDILIIGIIPDVFNEHKELVETIEQFCTTIRRILNV